MSTVELSVPTKNTFVHFDDEVVAPSARRGTCAGRLISVEAVAAARGNARSVTCQPEMCIPDIAVRRVSIDTDCSPVASPMSPPSFETPTVLFLPSQPVQCSWQMVQMSPQMSPPMLPMSPQMSPMSPPMSPMSPQMSPQLCPMSPMAVSTPPPSPRLPVSGWSTPPQLSTPPLTPQANADLMLGVWQSLTPQTQSPLTPRTEKATRSRRQKVVIPARASELTLMLKHLDMDLGVDAVQAQLGGFLGSIDFFYLPTNFETGKNLGYAFVNFTDRDAAAAFKRYWQESAAADEAVVDARVQGYAENVERFRNSSVMPMLAEDLQPRIFCQGRRQAFPKADGPAPAVGQRFRPTGQ